MDFMVISVPMDPKVAWSLLYPRLVDRLLMGKVETL